VNSGIRNNEVTCTLYIALRGNNENGKAINFLSFIESTITVNIKCDVICEKVPNDGSYSVIID